MNKDPTIQKVLDAVQGKPEAIKKLSAALITRDVAKIREAVSTSAGLSLSEGEVGAVLASMPQDNAQALAFCT